MKKITAFLLLATAMALCASSNSAWAGTLTLNPGSPSFAPPEAFLSNTITADTSVDGLIHLSGSASIVPPANVTMVTISVDGTFSADAGDKFSVAYQFSGNLATTGSIGYTISGDVNGIPIPSITGTIDPGLHIYDGTAESPTLPLAVSGTFSGTLTFDFTNAGGNLSAPTPGGLDLTVQQLDFQLNPNAVGVLPPSQAQNISTRANVGTGENVLIGGFIVTGTEDKLVVLRGLGPSITGTTTPDLEDPVLELHDASGALIDTNDNWGDLSDEDKTVLSDNGLEPNGDSEAALVETLAPGQYTTIVSGANGTTGIGLVEVYGLDDGTDSTLANISSRGFVEPDDKVMIAGFIIGGGGGGFSQVIVRGIGPSLADQGVMNPLADPVVEVFNQNGDSLGVNDNWMDDPNMQTVSDDGLAPSNPNEAALYQVLPPGEYTAIASGVNDTSGVALVEAYEVDNMAAAAAH